MVLSVCMYGFEECCVFMADSGGDQYVNECREMITSGG